MINGHSSLRGFANCRLDVGKKLLWADDRPVQLPLKAVELLCVLVEGRGEVITKEEIWHGVWNDAFVEETNLTHNIYLLRKALKELGFNELIETVPRRGYRFSGDVHEIPDDEIVVQRHELTTTTIEFEETSEATPSVSVISVSQKRTSYFWPAFAVLAAGVVIVSALGAIWVYRASASQSHFSTIHTLAVLPFREIASNNAPGDHRGLAIADSLITRLSNIKSIVVRPTSAIASFENTDIDSLQLGKNLQVDGVLEGTVFRTERTIRVTMRLLQVSDTRTIWSGEFEKPAGDEFSVEKEICLKTVDALSLDLNAAEQGAVSKQSTTNADAYDLYLKGRYEWNRRNWQGSIDAEHLFRSAVEKDPNFALAYVGLADQLAMGVDSYEATLSVNKAISLDPNLGEAHATLGFIKMFHEWNWKEAESELKKAIELNPGYANAHHWYGILLEIEDKNDDALVELNRALEINPLSYNYLADLGQAYYFTKQYDKAKEYCDKALAIYPEFNFAHVYLSDIYRQTGDYDRALEESIESERQSTLLLNGTDEDKARREKDYRERVQNYKRLGFQRYIEDKARSGPQSSLSCWLSAEAHIFAGNKHAALTDLEECYGTRPLFGLPFVKQEPMFDSLHDEPRFHELLRKMNLPD